MLSDDSGQLRLTLTITRTRMRTPTQASTGMLGAAETSVGDLTTATSTKDEVGSSMTD